MTTWHVWGDYAHTLPQEIGDARLVSSSDDDAKRTAESCGFEFERRVRNGFEPWAATFASEDGRDQEYAFAADPVVRGWKAL